MEINPTRIVLIAGIVASSSSSVAIGQTKRDLDAHRQGAVSLTMVLEPGVIYLDFRSPWMNLAGREHAAASDAEHRAVYEAIHSLADPQSLFTFFPGNCTAGDGSVLMTGSLILELLLVHRVAAWIMAGDAGAILLVVNCYQHIVTSDINANWFVSSQFNTQGEQNEQMETLKKHSADQYASTEYQCSAYPRWYS